MLEAATTRTSSRMISSCPRAATHAPGGRAALSLQIYGQIADLVQEEGAAVGLLEAADAVVDGAVKAP